MGIVIALGLAAVAIAIAAFRSWLGARARTAVLTAAPNTKPAEDAAAEHAHHEAEQSAQEVLRASSDDLARRVAELRARGRAGK